MRLFIAFDISDEAKSTLRDIQKKLNIKATFVKEFHLTLKFLGEVEDSKVESIIQELSKIKFDSFDAGLSNVGVFPDRKYVKVVWIGLEPHDKICALQKQVDVPTRNFGIAMDKDFVPHLTLARVKFIADKNQFFDVIDNIKLQSSEFKVDSFKLIKSTLTPQGPVYQVLNEFSAQQ